MGNVIQRFLYPGKLSLNIKASFQNTRTERILHPSALLEEYTKPGINKHCT